MKTNKYMIVGLMAAFLLATVGVAHASGVNKHQAYRAAVESTKGMESVKGSTLKHISKYDREQSQEGTMFPTAVREQAPKNFRNH